MIPNLESFKEYLQDRDIEENQIDTSLRLIEELYSFLKDWNETLENATEESFYRFSEILIENGRNSFEAYAALYRYGVFLKNKPMIITYLEILDGREMMPNFYKRLQNEYSQEVADEIFEGIGIPPLGIRPRDKARFTKTLVNRFLAKYDSDTCKTFFEKGLRDKYTDSYIQPAQLYKELGNIDEFLRIRHQNLVGQLERHLDEDSLFFTQEITEEVVAYVKARLSIEGGIRNGNRVTITKIPYQTDQYLEETDEKMRRYYFCHNPWIRDALREEEQPIDPVFCGCSAGYFKNFWEAVLGQPVCVEVIKSIINGDDVCEFALSLPDDLS
ncbi:MAG: hypothetical protein ACFFF4_02840 [Candidatus Thorarchaeota archaeon]